MSVPGIYKKVVELRKKIGAVKKNQTGQGINYKFRGYDALFHAARPAMDELGICLATHFVPDRDLPATYTTAKGGTGTQCAGLLRVQLIDTEDGSAVEYQAPYIAIDTSDKSCGKAASYAIKTALFTGLMIPTEDLPEHDAERPEIPDNVPALVAAIRQELTRPANAQYREQVEAKLDTTDTTVLANYLRKLRAR
jgi:hypothetical protein